MSIAKKIATIVIGVLLVLLSLCALTYLLLAGGFDGVGIAGYRNPHGALLWLVVLLFFLLLYAMYGLAWKKHIPWFWLLCVPYIAILGLTYIGHITTNSTSFELSYIVGPLLGSVWIYAMYNMLSWRWFLYPLIVSLLVLVVAEVI